MSAPISPEQATQDWIFTFGSGQQHDGRYVVITGTAQSARDVMVEHFGNRWSFQYADRERAGVHQFGLVELPASEWPKPADPDGLVAMLRHAAEHHDAHYVAALGEIRVLTRRGVTDAEFRARVIEILDAVQQVNDEIDEATEGGASR